MEIWNKLFGRAETPAIPSTPAAGDDPDTPLPPPPPPAVHTPPLREYGVGSLAELFLRSYLILSGRAHGSREQALAFDDWLESHRGEVHEVLAHVTSHPGCLTAEVAIPGGKVVWWEIPDPQIRFLCCYSGISGYLIPRTAAPPPSC